MKQAVLGKYLVYYSEKTAVTPDLKRCLKTATKSDCPNPNTRQGLSKAFSPPHSQLPL